MKKENNYLFSVRIVNRDGSTQKTLENITFEDLQKLTKQYGTPDLDWCGDEQFNNLAWFEIKSNKQEQPKKELIVKVQSWKTKFYLKGCTKAMVNQVLEIINPELRKICGNYTWSIQGESGNYKIIAFDKGQTFVESTGKTPRIALKNFHAAKKVLSDIYGITE